MFLLSCLVSALVMWLAIWLISRGQAEVSLKPVLAICVAISGVILVSFLLIGEWGLSVAFGVLILALNRWCFLSWPKAFLVAVVWLGSQMGFGWVVGPIF